MSTILVIIGCIWGALGVLFGATFLQDCNPDKLTWRHGLVSLFCGPLMWCVFIGVVGYCGF